MRSTSPSEKTVAEEPIPSSLPALEGHEAAPPGASEPASAAAVTSVPPAESENPDQPRLSIPPILLEGDEPARAVESGPVQKYSLGPAVSSRPAAPGEGELPRSYGTGKLTLAARDPHWLYAQWDLGAEEQRRHNAQAAHQHLVIRVHPEQGGQSPAEAHVHPESQHWFIHVENAGAGYKAELGYYGAQGEWVSLAGSPPVRTPPDAPAQDKSVRFTTVPPDVPLARLAELRSASAAGRKREFPLPSLPRAARESQSPFPRSGSEETERRAGPKSQKGFPLAFAQHAEGWTTAREGALAEVYSKHSGRQDEASSLALAELARGWMEGELAPLPASFELPLPGLAPAGISSFGREEQPVPRGFWLNVNADLIVFGATEPGAQVTVGGQPVRLRHDGTFNCRFALPDGAYSLPVTAISTKGDSRQAELDFYRATRHGGDIGEQPQEPGLAAPPSPAPG